MIIISDAGPLIGLARSGYLHILKDLFESVLVPPTVFEELKVSGSRPGAIQLSEVIGTAGWVRVSPPVTVPQALLDVLDTGKAEAIVLAKIKNKVLLIDERKGRRIASAQEVQITGTGAVLVAAKKKGFIQNVSPILHQLVQTGYRLSDSLQRKILELADE